MADALDQKGLEAARKARDEAWPLDSLEAIIRAYLSTVNCYDAPAELATLRAKVEELERERDEARSLARERFKALDQGIELKQHARRECDKETARADEMTRSCLAEREGRLAAEARVSELEAALARIADLDEVENMLDPSWSSREARAALTRLTTLSDRKTEGGEGNV